MAWCCALPPLSAAEKGALYELTSLNTATSADVSEAPVFSVRDAVEELVRVVVLEEVHKDVTAVARKQLEGLVAVSAPPRLQPMRASWNAQHVLTAVYAVAGSPLRPHAGQLFTSTPPLRTPSPRWACCGVMAPCTLQLLPTPCCAGVEQHFGELGRPGPAVGEAPVAHQSLGVHQPSQGAHTAWPSAWTHVPLSCGGHNVVDHHA